jgi:archaemetzincin
MSINPNKSFVYNFKTKIVLLLLSFCTLICNAGAIQHSIDKDRTIYIQPLGNVDSESLNYLKKSVEDFYGYNCVVKTKLELSKDIHSISKTSYEASKILAKYNFNSNLLLITEKDIAYKKSTQFPEWGIFGLGLRPGKTCVVST